MLKSAIQLPHFLLIRLYSFSRAFPLPSSALLCSREHAGEMPASSEPLLILTKKPDENATASPILGGFRQEIQLHNLYGKQNETNDGFAPSKAKRLTVLVCSRHIVTPRWTNSGGKIVFSRHIRLDPQSGTLRQTLMKAVLKILVKTAFWALPRLSPPEKRLGGC